MRGYVHNPIATWPWVKPMESHVGVGEFTTSILVPILVVGLVHWGYDLDFDPWHCEKQLLSARRETRWPGDSSWTRRPHPSADLLRLNTLGLRIACRSPFGAASSLHDMVIASDEKSRAATDGCVRVFRGISFGVDVKGNSKDTTDVGGLFYERVYTKSCKLRRTLPFRAPSALPCAECDLLRTTNRMCRLVYIYIYIDR